MKSRYQRLDTGPGSLGGIFIYRKHCIVMNTLSCPPAHCGVSDCRVFSLDEHLDFHMSNRQYAAKKGVT